MPSPGLPAVNNALLTGREQADFDGSMVISAREAEGLVRLLEAAPSVRRRYQFFVWMQTHVHGLIPHTVAICGTYRRQVKELVFETFNGVALPDGVTAQLGLTGAPVLQPVAQHWVSQGGAPRALAIDDLLQPHDAEGGAVWRSLQDCGLNHLLVHGVSRPDRLGEIESLFIFVQAGQPLPVQSYCLDLLMPHLHAVYLRVQTTERELGGLPVRARSVSPDGAGRRPAVTDRELQILFWVRQGKSNQQIGDELNISPLTVKNHVQKILRKLGASNRAQAVSLAIAGNLFKEPMRDRRA